MKCPNCQSLKITVFHCAGRYGRCDLIQHAPDDHYVCQSCGYEKLSSIWLGRHGDPAQGPLFWLCVPIVLVCVVGASAAKVALTWLKTKLPSRRVRHSRHCTLCGWRFSWEPGTPVTCGSSCEVKRQALSPVKLFCCDVDLEEYGDAQVVGELPENTISTTYRYRCPACDRIWLYIQEWHKDSGREADWYPQLTEAERDSGELPPLFDERTRTKVYEVAP